MLFLQAGYCDIITIQWQIVGTQQVAFFLRFRLPALRMRGTKEIGWSTPKQVQMKKENPSDKVIKQELMEIREDDPMQLQNYDSMIEDLRSIIGTAENEARMSIVEGYHEAGLGLIKYGLNKPEYLARVAQDLGKSKRTIYRILQFVDKWKTIDDFYKDVGLDASWHQVCNQYLVVGGEEQAEFDIKYDDLVSYIYENSNFLAKVADHTKVGVTIRISKDTLLKYVEGRK